MFIGKFTGKILETNIPQGEVWQGIISDTKSVRFSIEDTRLEQNIKANNLITL